MQNNPRRARHDTVEQVVIFLESLFIAEKQRFECSDRNLGLLSRAEGEHGSGGDERRLTSALALLGAQSTGNANRADTMHIT